MPTEDYPTYRRELNGLYQELSAAIPAAMESFSSLGTTALQEGEVPQKFKELIALGIGIARQCEGCIAYHVGGAINAGASDPEIMETIGVALLMGGGPASIYGCEALKALKQFRAQT